MIDVVAAPSPVVRPPFSDFSAQRFSPNVAFSVSLPSSASFFCSPSKLLSPRKTGKRSRTRVVEVTQGSRFLVYLAYEVLARGSEGLEARPFVRERNARFTRVNAQAEESLSTTGVSWAIQKGEGKLPWVPRRRQARGVKASAIRQSRGSKYTKFAHTPGNYNKVARNQESAFPGRSSSEDELYHASFAAKKNPRAPLPTENQQSRLHNEVHAFESIRKPHALGLSGNDHVHHHLSLGRADQGLHSNVKQQGVELDGEQWQAQQRPRKGALFMSKLENVLADSKVKNDSPKQSFSIIKVAKRVDDASRLHPGGGSQDWTGKVKEPRVSEAQRFINGEDGFCNPAKYPSITIGEGDCQGQHGEGEYTSVIDRKGLQSDAAPVHSLLKKTVREDGSGLITFNLFPKPPSVPWEANRIYPSSKHSNRNRRLLGRHITTSIGSRSTPSQRSVNKWYWDRSKFNSQVTSGVDDSFNREEGQRKSWSGDIRTQAGMVRMQVISQRGVLRCAEQVGSYVKLDSQAVSSTTSASEFGKKENVIEPGSRTKEEMKLEIDSQRTSKSGSDRSEKQVESLDFEWSDSDVEENTLSIVKKVMPLKSSPFAASPHDIHRYTVSDSEENTDNAFKSPSNAEVAADVEHSLSTSGNMGGKNVCTSSTPVIDLSLGACDISQHGSSPTFASWQKHNIPDLPFDFQFSYTETPKAPVLRQRETPFSPFGPSTMGRPWIGGPPHKLSKRKQRVFDSFKPPPRDLKGVKFVQDPGPYPEGQGPKAAKSREEVMGEPLTKEEIVYLVEKCQRENRQLNLGRDGLTHNMLDLIHSHWKRRRVCRIKCKGVPTVDMENVKFHIEDKTGGKIIYETGGVLYLFRGRNYNYKDRPEIPLMLWKPATPVYPKLIQPAPEGLTKEEAQRLRRLGSKVEPICTLGKNGVYLKLVDEVRAAFKVDELVRVDCRGLNASDYKKIGAKLKDLVPCVLLSFDKEHILMWKGKESLAKGESQAPHSEANLANSCNDVLHSGLSVNNGDEQIPKPTVLAQDACEAEEHSQPSTDHSDEKNLKLPVLPQDSSEVGGHFDTSINDDDVKILKSPQDSCQVGELADLSINEVYQKILKPAVLPQDLSEVGEASISFASLNASENEKSKEEVNSLHPVVSNLSGHERAGTSICAEESRLMKTSAEKAVTFEALSSRTSVHQVGDKKCGGLVSSEAISSSLSFHQVEDHEDQEWVSLETLSSSLSVNQVEHCNKESILSEALSSSVSPGSVLSSRSVQIMGDHKQGFDSLASPNMQIKGDAENQCTWKVDVNTLWEHAFESGMAIELAEDMDPDQIVRKADELAQSAPLAPIYTTKLMYKLQIKRDADDKAKEELQIHFGRVLVKKPKKAVKHKVQLPTVAVPQMGGLPVDELAKCLVSK